MEAWFRWFSFSIGKSLGSMLISGNVSHVFMFMMYCHLPHIEMTKLQDLVKSSYADVLAWGVDKLTALFG